MLLLFVEVTFSVNDRRFMLIVIVYPVAISNDKEYAVSEQTKKEFDRSSIINFIKGGRS